MIIIKIGSVTRAGMAREVLADNGIRAATRKMPDDPDGCAHGIVVAAEDAERARELLVSFGLKPGAMFNLDGRNDMC